MNIFIVSCLVFFLISQDDKLVGLESVLWRLTFTRS